MYYLLIMVILSFLFAIFFEVSCKFKRFCKILTLFINIIIVFFVLPEIIPELHHHYNVSIYILYLVMGFGLLLSILIDFFINRALVSIFHKTALIIALAGLLIHMVLDGLALHSNHTLSMGVVLHRIVFCIFIYRVVREQWNSIVGFSIIALISALTFLGYGPLSRIIIMIEHAHFLVYFQAFVIGMILHIIIDPVIHLIKAQFSRKVACSACSVPADS
jgi:hypothetical protein